MNFSEEVVALLEYDADHLNQIHDNSLSSINPVVQSFVAGGATVPCYSRSRVNTDGQDRHPRPPKPLTAMFCEVGCVITNGVRNADGFLVEREDRAGLAHQTRRHVAQNEPANAVPVPARRRGRRAEKAPGDGDRVDHRSRRPTGGVSFRLTVLDGSSATRPRAVHAASLTSSVEDRTPDTPPTRVSCGTGQTAGQ